MFSTDKLLLIGRAKVPLVKCTKMEWDKSKTLYFYGGVTFGNPIHGAKFCISKTIITYVLSMNNTNNSFLQIGVNI